MIILNVWAIPVGLVVLIVLTSLNHFLPGLLFGEDLHPTRNHIIISLVITAVGTVGEMMGVKGRVFFIPIWALGLIILGFTIGWGGILGLVAAFIVLCLVMSARGKRREAGEWAKAQIATASASQALTMNEKEFWKWVKEALFLPRWTNITPEVARNNIDVLETISRTGYVRSIEERTPFAGLTAEMGMVVATDKNLTTLDSKLQAAFDRILEAKLADPAKASAAAPPTLPETAENGEALPPRLTRS